METTFWLWGATGNFHQTIFPPPPSNNPKQTRAEEKGKKKVKDGFGKKSPKKPGSHHGAIFMVPGVGKP